MQWIECNLYWDHIPYEEVTALIGDIPATINATVMIDKQFGKKLRKYQNDIPKSLDAEANYNALQKEIREWTDKHPDIVKYREDIKTYNEKRSELIREQTFMGRGLNVPGTVIETSGGIKWIIGDINKMGCASADDEWEMTGEKVVRYCVLEIPPSPH